MNDFQISQYLFYEYLLLKQDKNHTKNDLLDEFFRFFTTKPKLTIFTNLDIDLSEHRSMLLQAFTHKSFFHEMGDEFAHNERLEFLGDSVLDLIVADKLLGRFKESSEGDISKLRSAIVNEGTLAKVASLIGLGSYLLIGKGELKEKGYLKDSILANTFEAVLGAIYTITNLEVATLFVESSFKVFQEQTGADLYAPELLKSFDSKSALQEQTMKLFNIIPKYNSESIKVDGEQLFKVDVELGGIVLDSTIHKSKKKGMQIVAGLALDKDIKSLKINQNQKQKQKIEVKKC